MIRAPNGTPYCKHSAGDSIRKFPCPFAGLVFGAGCAFTGDLGFDFEPLQVAPIGIPYIMHSCGVRGTGLGLVLSIDSRVFLLASSDDTSRVSMTVCVVVLAGSSLLVREVVMVTEEPDGPAMSLTATSDASMP